MTTIELRLFATLAVLTPANSLRYPIETGTTVAQLLNLLKIAATDAKLIFINGVLSNPDARLTGGERVGIFPPVGGG